MSGFICTKKTAGIMACLCATLCVFFAYASIWHSGESTAAKLFFAATLSLIVSITATLIQEDGKSFKERPDYKDLSHKQTVREAIKYSMFLLSELEDTRAEISRARFYLEDD